MRVHFCHISPQYNRIPTIRNPNRLFHAYFTIIIEPRVPGHFQNISTGAHEINVKGNIPGGGGPPIKSG